MPEITFDDLVRLGSQEQTQSPLVQPIAPAVPQNTLTQIDGIVTNFTNAIKSFESLMKNAKWLRSSPVEREQSLKKGRRVGARTPVAKAPNITIHNPAPPPPKVPLNSQQKIAEVKEMNKDWDMADNEETYLKIKKALAQIEPTMGQMTVTELLVFVNANPQTIKGIISDTL